MPQYVVRRVIDALNEQGKPLTGSKVCLLGVAYKKDVDDPRESPSFVLMELLRAGGAVISYNDPHIPKLPAMRHHDVPDLESEELTAEFLAGQDCVLVATDHSAFDYDFIVRHAAAGGRHPQRHEERQAGPREDPQGVRSRGARREVRGERREVKEERREEPRWRGNSRELTARRAARKSTRKAGY